MTTENILSIFKEIMKVPRESGHEEQIIAWLQKRAAAHNLECKTDQAGNVLIIREASKGCENSPTIILQSHSDMVCEKNAGVEHDFSKDPIVAVEENGWLIAKETTLGADCGIGMAAQLAVLEDDTLQHGRIEALFTTSEETGLTGAKSLEKDFISGKILINLDSEDEGELFIGCAGGVDTTAVFKYGTVEATKEYVKVLFRVYGAEGGHSGDDIDKNRANAVKILARLLYQIMDKCSIELYEIDGGNKKNAIAREAYAAIGFDRKDMGRVMKVYRENVAATKAEFALSDKNVEISAERIGIEDVDSGKMLYEPVKAIDGNTAALLVYALNAAPHGVLAMSNQIKGLVETSTNLASVKMMPGKKIAVGTSQRSSLASSCNYAAQQVEACFALAGATVRHLNEYPGWQPKMDSHVVDVTRKAYKKLFGKEPVVRAIHAGLECGLFLDKYPDLDMISFGPTLRKVHAPGERLELASLDKFRMLLEQVITDLK
ncbi:MAG: aminoacyl-histidine dipeptidase [Bacteroidetes bacterium]|uniref:Cytosol non-specific dipeptidase n=1 Tax=Candidatus Egerieousia excrementavium TaxID=2840778 RepID=A0A9D9DJQ3_9BACT|nr:aminoacyl-histidine dipeptidase [Candidatus Egerieousia excrementavium]